MPGQPSQSQRSNEQYLVAEECERQLRWLVLLRVAVASAILVATLYIQFLVGSRVSLGPLFTVIVTSYGVSLAFAVAHRLGATVWRAFAGVQLSFDVVLESLLVYFLGGMQSPFVVLYLLTVLAAGLMLSRRGAFAVASLVGIGYGLVGLSVFYIGYGWMPAGAFEAGYISTLVAPSDLYLRLFAMLLVSYGMAWLSSAMSTRLRLAGRELRVRRSQVEALRRLNERIIGGMSSGLLATDLEGTIVTFNSEAETITDRTAPELLGRKVWEVFGDSSDMLRRLDDRLRAQRMYRTVRPLRTSAGWRTIGMTVTRLETIDLEVGEETSVYVFMFRDLTEIKRMERELRVRDRMSVLGEMAGSIAHEIRNPLASISGSLQLLNRSNLHSDQPETEELVEIVIRESDRLSKTIDQFLEYARPGPFEPAEVNLLGLVEDTFTLLRNSRELRPDHELAIEAADEAYVAIVDPSQIKQVFWNLARNAIQAMPEGGRLKVGLERDKEGIEVTFEDNGTGMTSEDIETFFQPYVSGGRGTGLGLAVVYRILDQHGVRIEVDSELGEGTCFLLTFPEREAEEIDAQLVLLGGEPEGPR
ncbi:MAG: nitrogen regulation protein NR(II) [Acidobacteriota bacterium]